MIMYRQQYVFISSVIYFLLFLPTFKNLFQLLPYSQGDNTAHGPTYYILFLLRIPFLTNLCDLCLLLVSAPETFHVLLHFYLQFNQNKRSPKTGSEDVTDILLSNQADWSFNIYFYFSGLAVDHHGKSRKMNLIIHTRSQK